MNKANILLLLLLCIFHNLKYYYINTAPTGECQDNCDCDSSRQRMECDCRNNACRMKEYHSDGDISYGDIMISFTKQKIIYNEIRIHSLDVIDRTLFSRSSFNKNTKLYFTQVNYIGSNAFNYATFVELVEITYENMIAVEEGGFNGLKCEQLVLLADDQNYGLHLNVFNDNTDIRNLVLSYMGTNYLEQVFYPNNNDPNNKWLSNARIQILEILEVRCKPILDETWAPGFANLETIFIYRTDIEAISDSFVRLHSINLKHLILRENKIEILKPYMFSRFVHLVLLDLSDNPIKHIDEKSFVYLNNLQSLDFQGVFETYQIDDADFCTLAHLPCHTDVYLDHSLTTSCTLMLLSDIKGNEYVFMDNAPESYQSLDDRQLERVRKQCDMRNMIIKCFNKNPPINNTCLFEKYKIEYSLNRGTFEIGNIENDDPILKRDDETCKKKLLQNKRVTRPRLTKRTTTTTTTTTSTTEEPTTVEETTTTEETTSTQETTTSTSTKKFEDTGKDITKLNLKLTTAGKNIKTLPGPRTTTSRITTNRNVATPRAPLTTTIRPIIRPIVTTKSILKPAITTTTRAIITRGTTSTRGKTTTLSIPKTLNNIKTTIVKTTEAPKGGNDRIIINQRTTEVPKGRNDGLIIINQRTTPKVELKTTTSRITSNLTTKPPFSTITTLRGGVAKVETKSIPTKSTTTTTIRSILRITTPSKIAATTLSISDKKIITPKDLVKITQKLLLSTTTGGKSTVTQKILTKEKAEQKFTTSNGYVKQDNKLVNNKDLLTQSDSGKFYTTMKTRNKGNITIPMNTYNIESSSEANKNQLSETEDVVLKNGEYMLTTPRRRRTTTLAIDPRNEKSSIVDKPNLNDVKNVNVESRTKSTSANIINSEADDEKSNIFEKEDVVLKEEQSMQTTGRRRRTTTLSLISFKNINTSEIDTNQNMLSSGLTKTIFPNIINKDSDSEYKSQSPEKEDATLIDGNKKQTTLRRRNVSTSSTSDGLKQKNAIEPIDSKNTKSSIVEKANQNHALDVNIDSGDDTSELLEAGDVVLIGELIKDQNMQTTLRKRRTTTAKFSINTNNENPSKTNLKSVTQNSVTNNHVEDISTFSNNQDLNSEYEKNQEYFTESIIGDQIMQTTRRRRKITTDSSIDSKNENGDKTDQNSKSQIFVLSNQTKPTSSKRINLNSDANQETGDEDVVIIGDLMKDQSMRTTSRIRLISTLSTLDNLKGNNTLLSTSKEIINTIKKIVKTSTLGYDSSNGVSIITDKVFNSNQVIQDKIETQLRTTVSFAQKNENGLPDSNQETINTRRRRTTTNLNLPDQFKTLINGKSHNDYDDSTFLKTTTKIMNLLYIKDDNENKQEDSEADKSRTATTINKNNYENSLQIYPDNVVTSSTRRKRSTTPSNSIESNGVSNNNQIVRLENYITKISTKKFYNQDNEIREKKNDRHILVDSENSNIKSTPRRKKTTIRSIYMTDDELDKLKGSDLTKDSHFVRKINEYNYSGSDENRSHSISNRAEEDYYDDETTVVNDTPTLPIMIADVTEVVTTLAPVVPPKENEFNTNSPQVTEKMSDIVKINETMNETLNTFDKIVTETNEKKITEETSVNKSTTGVISTESINIQEKYSSSMDGTVNELNENFNTSSSKFDSSNQQSQDQNPYKDLSDTSNSTASSLDTEYYKITTLTPHNEFENSHIMNPEMTPSTSTSSSLSYNDDEDGYNNENKTIAETATKKTTKKSKKTKITTTTISNEDIHDENEDDDSSDQHDNNYLHPEIGKSIVHTTSSHTDFYDESEALAKLEHDYFYQHFNTKKKVEKTTTNKIWLFYPAETDDKSLNNSFKKPIATTQKSYLVVNEKPMSWTHVDLSGVKIFFAVIIFVIISICCIHFLFVFVRIIRRSETFLKHYRVGRGQSEAILLSHISTNNHD